MNNYTKVCLICFFFLLYFILFGLIGEFRFINSRLITNCEEIAFYNGHTREEINLKDSFSKLVNHYRDFIQFRFSMGFIDNIIAKCNYFLIVTIIN
jgi:ABC-type uncharacterized transport system fused permease/ATPase subunit